MRKHEVEREDEDATANTLVGSSRGEYRLNVYIFKRYAPSSCNPLAPRRIFSSADHACPSADRDSRLPIAARSELARAVSTRACALEGAALLRNIPNRTSGSTGSLACLTSRIPV